jgi:hypothetical protein
VIALQYECWRCGHVLGAMATVGVINGRVYCKRCRWLADAEERHPCTPPAVALLPPPSLGELTLLDACRQRDARTGAKFSKFIAAGEAWPEQELAHGVFGEVA